MPQPSNAFSGAAILAVLGLAAIFAWKQTSETDVVYSREIMPNSREGGEALEELSLPDTAERSSVRGLAELSAAEQMIESFFGDDADAVKALIAENGGDLETMPLPIPEATFRAALPAWLVFKPEERAEQRRSMKSLPETIDNDWIQKRLGMTTELNADQLDSLDALASLYSPDLELSIDRYMDSLEAALAYELQRKRVQVSPFISWKPATSESPFKSFYTLSRAGQGWNASVALNQFEHPIAYGARGDVAKGVQTRDQALRTAIVNM